MTTHFITAEINLEDDPLHLQQAIESELKMRGEPLRWAITSVDKPRQKVKVEAVVTTTNKKRSE